MTGLCDGSLHYIEMTFNALRSGWDKENIASHYCPECGGNDLNPERTEELKIIG
jgi:hypothetical protein